MALVRLEDVIHRVNTKEDKDHTDLIYYVGGEHLDSGNIRVTKRGVIEGSTIGPMFYYGFKAGDFLLVSRNPHLKKAGVVDFDGICSEKTFVLSTVDEHVLLPEYLPFVLQNERFWEYAVQHRHGSTNTFINWSTLASYEFDLPNLNTQRKLASALWSINDTMEAYKKLITATDELVKSQFMEQFGNCEHIPAGWKRMTIGQACTLVNGRAFKPSDWVKAGTPIVRIQNLNDPTAEFNYCEGDVEEKFWIDTGTLLFAWSGTPGTSFGAFIWTGGKAVLNQHIFQVYPCPDISKQFLKCSFDGHMDEIIKKAHGGVGLRHITKQELEKITLLVPPMDVQNAFVTFAQQSDKSKFELEQALSELTATYKRIINENLG